MADTPASNASRRASCAWVALIVATLVLVPTLVRATQTMAGSASTSIRLNRGFDVPESKCRVAPPVAPVSAPIELEAVSRATFEAERSSDVVPRPQSQHDASPQVLRGPPVSTRLS